jgi:hypothetical protein
MKFINQLSTGLQFATRGRITRLGYFQSIPLLLLLMMAVPSVLPATDPPLAQVAPVDWSGISPASVGDRHVYIPIGHQPNQSFAYYLGNFHRIANAVRDNEPNRGFIDIQVWRQRDHNIPQNARIMDNVLSIAWMYAKDEPWNPYYGDPATRMRLEAALAFWLSLQTNGHFLNVPWSNTSGLGITMFATKFMAETLNLLQNAPPIDEELLEKLRQTLRTSLLLCLTNEVFVDYGRSFSNMYGNVFAGALGYLNLVDDTELEEALAYRLERMDEMLSAAGFLSEMFAPDWGYYFGTHHTNIYMSWFYGRDRVISETNVGELLQKEYELTTEWLAYNAVPDKDLFFLNRAIETRSERNHFNRLETPLSEVVPLARAFSVTQQEYEDRLISNRSQLVSNWNNPPQLIIGPNGYTPYDFYFREFKPWYPSSIERDEAFAQLPYIANEYFNHQRVDNWNNMMFTYVRRPAYYAAFNSGPAFRSPIRYGLGLIWHPEAGLVLQSPSGTAGESWGTRIPELGVHFEASDLNPVEFVVNGQKIVPTLGATDILQGDLQVIYPGNQRFFDKRLKFSEDRIDVLIDFIEVSNPRYETSQLVELLPMMVGHEDILFVRQDTVVMVRDDRVILAIAFNGADDIRITPDRLEGHLRRTNVEATAIGRLSYSLIFNPENVDPNPIVQEPSDFVEIYTLQDLKNINLNLGGNYILMSDLDLGESEFTPLAENVEGRRFSGIFDGNGYVLSNLKIRNQNINSGTGLFTAVDTDGIVRNLGLRDIDVIGGSNTGGFVGQHYGTIINCWTSGTVRSQTGGRVNTGGIVGVLHNGAILQQSYSNARVSGTNRVTGGLVGFNVGGTILDSYATGIVTAERVDSDGFSGGLVGRNEGAIRTSYAIGAVIGTTRGGLAGTSIGLITNSYWDAQTTGISTGSGDGSSDLSTAFALATNQMSGLSALEYMSGLDFEQVWATSENYPVLKWQDIVETGTSLEQGSLPKQLSLGQNWPNPFNSQTIISYSLPASMSVRLAVYDVLGRQVGLLVNEMKAAGHYEVRWNASGLSSGIYVYRLEAGGQNVSRNMMLVR